MRFISLMEYLRRLGFEEYSNLSSEAGTTGGEDTLLVAVAKNRPDTVIAFKSLATDYFSDMPPGERDQFIQSILARQGEPKRWLLLLRHRDEYIGFVHMKINDEHPGWGFILEFYIVPNKRRLGWGRRLFTLCSSILREQGVSNVWLLTDPPAEPFWRSLGFRETGETIDGRRVWAASI